MKYNMIKSTGFVLLGLLATACNDFLDEQPTSDIFPEAYFTEASHLEAYANDLYVDFLPSHTSSMDYGVHGKDKDTDNQAARGANTRFTLDRWMVSQQNTQDGYYFDNIRKCNYFLEQVMPKFEAGTIGGNESDIKQYIGEIYFLRAHEYFKRLQMMGDFPIVSTVLPDQEDVLIEASKRAPRNEVARFILSDLDNAIALLKTAGQVGRKTRINRDVAMLLKSRVALFEGTWLKYFKGTPFVPNGPGWPGKAKDYNANYEYPTGSIEAESTYFLKIAMEAAKEVADAHKGKLTENTGTVPQSSTDPVNPFMAMFYDVDLSGYDEVLLWREYSQALNVCHNVNEVVNKSNYGIGVTRGLVEGFLMKNGMPIYADGSGYHGDLTIAAVRKDRDPRLSIFLKEPGQKNILQENAAGTQAVPIEPMPDILSNVDNGCYSTGYCLRKGGSFDQIHCMQGKGFTGCPVFRAAEALLNYMEASYEVNGTVDATAAEYWRILRKRAGVDEDFQKTISLTDMQREKEGDWGAYSAGVLIDPTLFNIRRERRCELMAEGLRDMDLHRWRAMDQMITTPYHIEGINFWGGEMHNDPVYKDSKTGESLLIWGADNRESNVSAPELSNYLRPYEKVNTSTVFDGYHWKMAHYLSPLSIYHFDYTSKTGNVEDSPLYQNPYWPMVPNEVALQ